MRGRWPPTGSRWACLPIGLPDLALAPRVIPESRVPDAGGTDPIGTALVTAGLTAIVLPLVEGRQHGWPLWTWLSLAAAPVLLGGFWRQQQRVARSGGARSCLPPCSRHRALAPA